MREPQEVEGFGTPLTTGAAVRHGVPAELDAAGLVRVKSQAKFVQPLLQVGAELFRISTGLEACDKVIGVADQYRFALCRLPSSGSRWPRFPAFPGTMKVLRLPAPHALRLIDSPTGSVAACIGFVSAKAIPALSRPRAGPGVLVIRVSISGTCLHGQMRDIPGCLATHRGRVGGVVTELPPSQSRTCAH